MFKLIETIARKNAILACQFIYTTNAYFSCIENMF